MKFPNLGKNEFKRKNPKFWFNGKLITKAEHDSLSFEQIQSWNNIINRKVKK